MDWLTRQRPHGDPQRPERLPDRALQVRPSLHPQQAHQVDRGHRPHRLAALLPRLLHSPPRPHPDPGLHGSRPQHPPHHLRGVGDPQGGPLHRQKGRVEEAPVLTSPRSPRCLDEHPRTGFGASKAGRFGDVGGRYEHAATVSVAGDDGQRRLLSERGRHVHHLSRARRLPVVQRESQVVGQRRERGVRPGPHGLGLGGGVGVGVKVSGAHVHVDAVVEHHQLEVAQCCLSVCSIRGSTSISGKNLLQINFLKSFWKYLFVSSLVLTIYLIYKFPFYMTGKISSLNC